MKNQIIIKIYKFILDVIVEIANTFINVAGIVSLITIILLGNVYEWDFQKIFYDLSLLKNEQLVNMLFIFSFSTFVVLTSIKVLLKSFYGDKRCELADCVEIKNDLKKSL
ncbi:MAG: hypothetical protein AB7S49_04040 [Arcobacter sp.]|uniref:hypothetical protein n=1 Tax=Arcobacter sp. TaxID=1872629 RepID=UPI003CFF666F